MRIKKLELLGFKSFKDRTVIQFDPGTTGIVGPNGCGKSNIVDALVWVMGEMSAKHLRGANMSDVIFAGSQDYAPMGMCEVSLTLENDGGPFPAKYAKHSEVMVTRRLHRSGESEYLINKEGARLKDIQEIFMDTGAGAKGFSIIAQGAIGKIITAKPIDRRNLIEEAAGITKFKVRKRESQRKLISTDQNLVRLQDIIGEQKRQLGSLERQAQRAERYRKLKTEIKDKDLFVSSKSYITLKESLDEAQRLFESATESEVGTSSDIGQWESDLESLRLQVVEKEKIVEEKQTALQKSQTSVQEMEYQVRELKFEIEQAKRDKEKTSSIQDQYRARQQVLTADKERLDEEVAVLRESTEEVETLYIEKNSYYENIHQRTQDADEELTTKRREFLVQSQVESQLEAQIMSKQTQLDGLEQRISECQDILTELEAKRHEFEGIRNSVYKKLEAERQLQLDIMKDVENFEENVQMLKSQEEQKRSEVEKYKEELNQISGKLYGLENLQANFEGFEKGVKSVMLWQKQKEQHADGSVSFQPIAEVVEVPEKYEMAMEAALGTRLQMLLSNDSESSLGALEYLKENKSGRSSFVPKDLAESGDSDLAFESLCKEEGFESSLVDVVRVPEEFKAQVGLFLKDIVVVDSIRTALHLRSIYKGKTFVTMDGDTLTSDGILTGGSSEGVDSGVLQRRREIKDLSQKREEAAGKLSLAQASFKKISERYISVSKDLEESKKKSSEKDILVVEFKKDLERAETELANVDRAIERQKSELSQQDLKKVDVVESIAELTEKKIEAGEAKVSLEGDVDALTAELKKARDGIEELQSEVRTLQVSSASKRQQLEGMMNQLEMVTRSLNEVEVELSKMNEETGRSEESLSSNSILVEQKQSELELQIVQAQDLQKILGEARDSFENTSAQCKEVEERVNKSQRALNEYKAKINEAQLKVEQFKMKEQYLLNQIHERYMVDLSEEAVKYADQEGDIKAIEAEVAELKGKLAKIGEVNLSAIEEYDDLSERFKFLSQQHDDLTEAKEQLRKVIDRINRICSRRFKETFELVNERFQKVFPVLFGGGEAKLILVENEEKGEMGIDIVAKPPGKKPQTVGLLSGGEKALTAVSLIFSIFLVKPSPFCLLDEVDAPLDDANVMRFNDLVKEMAKRSQIIIVTHNKHTMKVNKKLYGVTQEERGVSKMVSVALDQTSSFADELLG